MDPVSFSTSNYCTFIIQKQISGLFKWLRGWFKYDTDKRLLCVMIMMFKNTLAQNNTRFSSFCELGSGWYLNCSSRKALVRVCKSARCLSVSFSLVISPSVLFMFCMLSLPSAIINARASKHRPSLPSTLVFKIKAQLQLNVLNI